MLRVHMQLALNSRFMNELRSEHALDGKAYSKDRISAVGENQAMLLK